MIKTTAQEVLSLLPELLSQDCFFLYDFTSRFVYVGSTEPLSTVALEDTPIEAFYVQPFFPKAKLSSPWTGFKKGRLSFPCTYRFFLNNCWPVIEGVTEADMSVSREPYRNWEDLFNKTEQALDSGRLEKAVPMQFVTYELEEDIDLVRVLTRLLGQNISAITFCYKRGNKAWVGASPEVLVSKRNNKIVSYALAGTVPRQNTRPDFVQADDEALFLLNDEKNGREHEIVVREIAKTLGRTGAIVHQGVRSLLPLTHVWHLKTEVYLDEDPMDLPLLDWVEALHPTPALAGYPKQESMDFLQEEENHQRGFFGAPIGVVERSGDGVFAVGIRSALITGNTALGIAGCGIVKGSDCQKEYSEIASKLLCIENAL